MKFNLRLLILLETGLVLIVTATTVKTQGYDFVAIAQKAELQLTTSVLEQRSCSPAHFGLTLRLKLRNIGDATVILHKQRAISRIMVSSDLAASNSKKYEQDLRYDDPGASNGLEQPVFSDFAILKRGEVIEFEEPVSIYLFNEKRSSERFLAEGTHVLQVDVGSWPYVVDPLSFRKKWRDKGYLWFEGLTSEPMPFIIEKDRQLTKCT